MCAQLRRRRCATGPSPPNPVADELRQSSADGDDRRQHQTAGCSSIPAALVR